MTIKYKVLIAMDCDGCYEDSMDWNDASKPGVVKQSELDYIQELGGKVTFVSDSPLCYHGWEHFGHEGDGEFGDYVLQRYGNLKAARVKYPASFYLYISDNPGDESIAQLAGFSLLHPNRWGAYYSILVDKLKNFP